MASRLQEPSSVPFVVKRSRKNIVRHTSRADARALHGLNATIGVAMYPTRPPALAIALAGCIAGLAACTQSQTAPAMGSGAAVPALPSGMQAARDRGSYDYDLDPAF